jgi:hypothetical protein
MNFRARNSRISSKNRADFHIRRPEFVRVVAPIMKNAGKTRGLRSTFKVYDTHKPRQSAGVDHDEDEAEFWIENPCNFLSSPATSRPASATSEV